MEDIVKKMGEAITSEFAKEGVPPIKKYDLMKKIQSESDKGGKNHFTDFLKNKKDFVEIYTLIKNKRLSANQIRSKIKEFLNDPEDLNDFLQSMLDSKKSKKEESKEATSAGSSSGAFEPMLTGGEEEKINTKNIPTVRESKEYCDSCDRVKSKCICGKPKKMETKEATSSSSSGQFSQPAIWAKSMSKKNWKGASTKYMPGAKRVQVKKKCKTVPYCNQGDINALKIFENENVQKAIDSVSSSHGYDKEYISEIVFREIRKRQN